MRKNNNMRLDKSKENTPLYIHMYIKRHPQTNKHKHTNTHMHIYTLHYFLFKQIELLNVMFGNI